MRQFGTKVGWALVLTAVMAGIGYAAILQADQSNIFLPGVDRNGNPDANRGGFGSGKIYKDTRTGILYATANANVRNAYGRTVLFTNLSYNINDPWAKESHQATSDAILVNRPDNNGVAAASSWAVYIP